MKVFWHGEVKEVSPEEFFKYHNQKKLLTKRHKATRALYQNEPNKVYIVDFIKKEVLAVIEYN